MVPFGGWNMPLQYEGILKEYDYNRKTVSIFDCSHMGEFLIEGDLEASGLNRIVTQRLKDMPIKTCRYGTMCQEQGGVIDDLIVYRIAQEKWMIVVNAANTDKNRQNFQSLLTSQSSFQDITFKTAKLDIQGPLSRDLLVQYVPEIKRLEYYSFDEFVLLGERCIISRTGYTGELGYEIYFPWEKARILWKEILKNDHIKPTGLGIRDVLRIEMCYPLYGHELDEKTTPLEAGLKKFVDFEKEFIGRDVLLRLDKSGNYKKTFYFVSENRRSPRQHYKIWNEEGREIGEVTSGTFSPALERGIGIGFVEGASPKPGAPILFGDENVKVKAEIVSRPFYKTGTLKNY